MENEIVRVVDFSAWKQRVSFEMLALAGVEVAICRVSSGNYYGDIAYRYNVEQGVRHGIEVPGFHYFDPRKNPIWQADAFVAALPYTGIRCWLDLEFTGGVSDRLLANRATKCLQQIEQQVSVKPGIYTRAIWFNLHIGPYIDWAGEYPLWVAHYTKAAKPYMPRGWNYYHLWQYSKHGWISGINRSLDFNRLGVDIGKLLTD